MSSFPTPLVRRSQNKPKESIDIEVRKSGGKVTRICESIDSPHIKEIIISTEAGKDKPIVKHSDQFEKLRSVRSSQDSHEKDTQQDSKIEQEAQLAYSNQRRVASPNLAQQLLRRFGSVYNSNVNIKQNSFLHSHGFSRGRTAAQRQRQAFPIKAIDQNRVLMSHANEPNETSLQGLGSSRHQLSQQHNRIETKSRSHIHNHTMSEKLMQQTTKTISEHRHKTLSSDNLSMEEETVIQKNISQSQNKLRKNLGLVYNKIALENITNQKRQIAEVALKKTFKTQQEDDKANKLIRFREREKEFQEMNTKSFLRYLNRDNLAQNERYELGNNPENFRSPVLISGEAKPLALFRGLHNESYRPVSQAVEELSQSIPSPSDRRQVKISQKFPISKVKFRQQFFGPLNPPNRSRVKGDLSHLSPSGQNVSNYDFILMKHSSQPASPFSGSEAVSSYKPKKKRAGGRDKIQMNVVTTEAQFRQTESCHKRGSELGKPNDDFEEGKSIDATHNFQSVSREEFKQNWTAMQTTQSNNIKERKNMGQLNQRYFSNRNIAVHQDNAAQYGLKVKKNSLFPDQDPSASSQEKNRLRQKKYYEERSVQSIKSDKQLTFLQGYSEIQDSYAHQQEDSPVFEREEGGRTNQPVTPARPFNMIQIEKKQTAMESKFYMKRVSQESQGRESYISQSRASSVSKSPLQRRRIKTKSPLSQATKKARKQQQQKELKDIKGSKQEKKQGSPGACLKVSKMKSGFKFSRPARRNLPNSGNERKPLDQISEAPTLIKQSEEVEKVNLEMEELFAQFEEVDEMLNQKRLIDYNSNAHVRYLINNPHKLKELNSQGMSKDIKILNQICQRLVSASDEYPSISIDEPMEIELQPDITLFYRLYIRNLPSPLKFEINYHNVKPSQSNLDVFLSTTEKTPSSLSSEIRFSSKESFFLQADKIGLTSTAKLLEEAAQLKKNPRAKQNAAIISKNSSKELLFKDKFLYIALNSFSGCSITIAIRNIESRHDINKKKLELYRKEKEEIYEMAHNYFNPREPYYREMLKMVAKQNQLVRRHARILKREGFQIYYPNPEKREQWRQDEFQRQQDAQERKGLVDDYKFKRAVFMQFKQKILSHIRLQTEDEKIMEVHQSYYASNFIHMAKTIRLVKQIYRYYMEERLKIKRRRNALFMALTFKIHFGRKMLKFGFDHEERMRKKARNILSFLSVSQTSKYETQAKKIVTVYLSKWSQCFKMATQVLKYASSVHNVLLRFEWTHHISRLRLDALRTTIWQKQLMKLCQTLTAIKNEKHQRLWQTIVKVDERTKQFIIAAYNYRQKHVTKIRFMRWFVEKEELKEKKNRSSKYELYKNKLLLFEDHFEAIEEFLTRYIDKHTYAFQTPNKLVSKDGKKGKKQKKNPKDSQPTTEEPSKDSSGLKAKPMPHSEFFQPGNPDVFKKLVVRAALIEDGEMAEWHHIVDEFCMLCWPKYYKRKSQRGSVLLELTELPESQQMSKRQSTRRASDVSGGF